MESGSWNNGGLHPSTRHHPKQRHGPSLHRCGQVSLATAGSLAGKAAGEGPRQSSSRCFVGWLVVKKKLCLAWWGEVLYLLPTRAGFLLANNWHCWKAESAWSQPKALVIHLSERKSLKKMNWVGKQKALAGEQPVTGIYSLCSSKWWSLICLALCKSH